MQSNWGSHLLVFPRWHWSSTTFKFPWRFSNLVIEGDSRKMVLMLTRKASLYWNLQDPVASTHNLMISLGNCSVNHMYRSGNKVVNSLANLGDFTLNLVKWDNILHFPSQVLELIQHDAKVLSQIYWYGYDVICINSCHTLQLWQFKPAKQSMHIYFYLQLWFLYSHFYY